MLKILGKQWNLKYFFKNTVKDYKDIYQDAIENEINTSANNNNYKDKEKNHKNHKKSNDILKENEQIIGEFILTDENHNDLRFLYDEKLIDFFQFESSAYALFYLRKENKTMKQLTDIQISSIEKIFISFKVL